MGKNFVSFSCHHCNHCCTEVVCLPTPFDVRRIAKHTRMHPKKFLEFLTEDEIDEVDDDDPTWIEVQDERYLMALKRTEEHGCHFLDRKTRYCSIYEARPILCRLYPFKLEESKSGKFKGFSLHDDVGCPRHRDGKVPVGPLRELYEEDCVHQEEYVRLVKKFNKKRDRWKGPQDFIAYFLERG